MLGCDNPFDQRPAASGRSRHCDLAITRCPARITSGVTPYPLAPSCTTSPSKRSSDTAISESATGQGTTNGTLRRLDPIADRRPRSPQNRNVH